MSGRGLSVFLSSVSLEELGIAAYKKAIDDALDSAQVLVAVGTSGENLESEWVRYEWDSFFNDILSGIKPDGRVFTYVEGVEIASLPRALRQTQYIEHGSDSMERLYRFVARALGISASSGGGEAGVEARVQSTRDYVVVSDLLVSREPLNGVNWLTATQHARSLRLGGYSGWQLPSIDQLRGIRATGLFDATRYHSRDQCGDQEAYYVHFEDGRVGAAPKRYERGISAIFVRELRERLS